MPTVAKLPLDRLTALTHAWVIAYRATGGERRILHDRALDRPDDFDALGDLEVTSADLHGLITTFVKWKGMRRPEAGRIDGLHEMAVERRPDLAAWLAANRRQFSGIVALFEGLDYQRLLLLSAF